VSTSLFGGTAPAANDWLIDRTGSNLVPAYYMIAACLVGAVALHFVVETKGCSLRGRLIPGVAEKVAAARERVVAPLAAAIHDREPVGAARESDRT
jgi:MFS transporter, MHS family, proline/betaine transporter